MTLKSYGLAKLLMALKPWNMGKLKLHNVEGQSQSLGKHISMLWSPKIPWNLKKKMKTRSPSSTMPPSIYGTPIIAWPNSPTKDNALKLTPSNLFQILHDRLQWDLVSIHDISNFDTPSKFIFGGTNPRILPFPVGMDTPTTSPQLEVSFLVKL